MSIMVRPPARTVRPVMERWNVLRYNPATDEVDQFEIVCEAKTFPSAYRAYGEGFNPLTDDWTRDLVETWELQPELVSGMLITVEV